MTIDILLNGTTHAIPAPARLQDLLDQLVSNDSFAIAINETFIPQSRYTEIELTSGDRVEIVVPMQGG